MVPFFPSSLKLGMGIQREKLMDICRIEIIFLLIAYIVCFCLLLSAQGARMLSSRLRTVLFVGPGANWRAEFPVPSLWAKLLEEIRLRHSSAERTPGIADVKNGVPGRVQSGLCVTELANFCSENTH